MEGVFSSHSCDSLHIRRVFGDRERSEDISIGTVNGIDSCTSLKTEASSEEASVQTLILKRLRQLMAAHIDVNANCGVHGADLLRIEVMRECLTSEAASTIKMLP